MSIAVANGTAPAAAAAPAPETKPAGGAPNAPAPETTPAEGETKPAPGETPEPEKKPEEKPEDKRFAAKFAALSRREREVQKAEKEIADARKKIADFEADQKLKEEDPLAWAEKHGLSYGKLTEHVLKGKPDPTAARLKELEDRLKREDEEKLESERKAEEEKYQKTIDGFVGGIKEHLTANAEALELLNLREDAADIVYNLIAAHFDRTAEKDEDGNVVKEGLLLSVAEAADMAEGYLFEEAQKLTKTKKLGGAKPADQADKKPGAKTEQVPGDDEKPVRTLTNALQADAPTTAAKPKTREESLAEAAKLIRWIPKT